MHSHMDIKPDMAQLNQAHADMMHAAAMQAQHPPPGYNPYAYHGMHQTMSNSSPLMSSPGSSLGSPGSEYMSCI